MNKTMNNEILDCDYAIELEEFFASMDAETLDCYYAIEQERIQVQVVY